MLGRHLGNGALLSLVLVSASMYAYPASHVAKADSPKLAFYSSGKLFTVPIVLDASVVKKSAPEKIEVIGELKQVAIVLIDTYASKPAGMSRCQAGEERFLRIFSLANKTPIETFRLKLESCRDNIELESPGIEWSPVSSTLKINWLFGPTAPGKPHSRILIIGPDGRLRAREGRWK